MDFSVIGLSEQILSSLVRLNFDLSLEQGELEPGAVLAFDLVSEGALFIENVSKPVLLAFKETSPSRVCLLDDVIGSLDSHLSQRVNGQHFCVGFLDQVHADDALV